MGNVQREKPAHSYSGDKWITNKTNKKHLKKDFHSRCAYCDDLDFYHGGEKAFHVDHFAPKEKFPALIHRYENLLYVCPYCNQAKSDKWPSTSPDENIVGDEGFANPCFSEYDDHLSRCSDGSIASKSSLGDYMVRNLKLYLKRHQVFYKIEQIEQKRETIKEMIKQRSETGGDISNLEAALSALEADFFTYYNIWRNLDATD